MDSVHYEKGVFWLSGSFSRTPFGVNDPTSVTPSFAFTNKHVERKRPQEHLTTSTSAHVHKECLTERRRQLA
jgi:hypothetical protein